MRDQIQHNFLNLTDQERCAIEISHIFEEELGIPSSNIGLTGSILWKGVHAQSDIDMIIYGIHNMRKFFTGIDRLILTQDNLTHPSLTEKISLAGKFSQKSGLPIEDCTVFISKKKFLLKYWRFYLSIAFNPTTHEITQNTLATKNTRFINLPGWESVIIKASVKEDDWLYFYPGVVYLENVEFISVGKNIEEYPSICRAVIFEHENVGYYGKGDLIEIRGLVQTILNPPQDIINESPSEFSKKKNYAQIVVGTFENYGAEYIKNLNL
jgi:predicted nucleotidyltransferase